MNTNAAVNKQFAFAHSGDEALRYLNDQDHETILILPNINMPGMSGLQLPEQIKQKY